MTVHPQQYVHVNTRVTFSRRFALTNARHRYPIRSEYPRSHRYCVEHHNVIVPSSRVQIASNSHESALADVHLQRPSRRQRYYYYTSHDITHTRRCMIYRDVIHVCMCVFARYINTIVLVRLRTFILCLERRLCIHALNSIKIYRIIVAHKCCCRSC